MNATPPRWAAPSSGGLELEGLFTIPRFCDVELAGDLDWEPGAGLVHLRRLNDSQVWRADITVMPAEALQLRSLVRADQILELFLDMVPVSEPGPDEVLIRVEAAPLNPSDMGLLFGGADMAAAVASGSAERPVVTAPIPDAAIRGLAGRVGTPMPVGNEGAGTVVAAGESPAAQALLGKVVAAAGGGMYSQYRPVNVALCLELPAGANSQARSPSKRSPATAVRQLARNTSSSRTAPPSPAIARRRGGPGPPR